MFILLKDNYLYGELLKTNIVDNVVSKKSVFLLYNLRETRDENNCCFSLFFINFQHLNPS